MIRTIAQYNGSKVVQDSTDEFVLVSNRRCNYANNPVDVILFEEDPITQTKLMEQVLKWKSGYRILSMSR